MIILRCSPSASEQMVFRCIPKSQNAICNTCSIRSPAITIHIFSFECKSRCTYDYLEVIDTHYSESNRIYPQHARHSFSRNFNSNATHHEHDYHSNNSVDFFQNFLGIYREHTTYLIQTPDMNQIHDVHLSASTIPRRVCGDWNSKIKLLRRVSNGPVLGLHFSSDYSHHFGGYKAKVFIKNGTLYIFAFEIAFWFFVVFRTVIELSVVEMTF